MSEAPVRATPPPLPPGVEKPEEIDPTDPNANMPMRFGKYTLIRQIALGGMAELFLALQRSVAGFEKLIVVKRVLPHLAKDDSFIEMLLAEARIAATLNHPNIAHVYDVGKADGRFYIAMEHVNGEDLRSLVRQMKKKGVTAFPLEHALAIVLGCCAGLAYAHDKRDLDGEPMGIVHRDVSPQNILVTFTGDVKLVDFGIAKAGRGQMEDTGSGQLKGKVPYMSPEQAQGLHLDNRSDIFSLGIMLFELCTGRRLFRGKNEMETL
ncbi:MAG: serine/threonine protein kinase, partial [Myxococcales bacterium]|nr:serine/threonine protein kinase [Myxococcales bacterium]